MSSSNPSRRQAILASYESLFEEAKKTGKWFYQGYLGIWRSPRELQEDHKRGKFLIGAQNWVVLDPHEQVDKYDRQIRQIEEERERFIKRWLKEKELINNG